MKLIYLTFILLLSFINIFAQKDSSAIFEKILSNGSSKTWHAPVFQKYFTFKLKSKNAEWMATRGREIRSRKFSKWSVKKQSDNNYILSFPKNENYLGSADYVAHHFFIKKICVGSPGRLSKFM